MSSPTSPRIIIVEDDPADAPLLVKLLKRLEFTDTTVVDSIEKARQALKTGRFDLALVNIVLRNRDDGIEIARIMQGDYGLPVVFITGHSDEEAIYRAKQIRPYGYLIKPITRTGLDTTLEAALHRVLVDDRLKYAYRELEAVNQSLTKEVEERQKAAAVAIESESRWRTMTETAPDAVFLMDGEGRFLYVNAVAARNFKCSPEDLIGRKESDVLPPEITEPHLEWVNRVLRDREPLYMEDHLQLPAGEMWFDTRLVPLPVEGNAPNAVLGVSRDITDRKLRERELHETLAYLEENRRELNALLRAADALVRHDDFQDAARDIFQECKEIIGATSGYIAMLSPDGMDNEVVFSDSGGRPCTVNADLPMPVKGLQAISYETGRPIFENAFMESEWAQYLPQGHVPLDNVMFVPLILDGRTRGFIGLADKPGGFTEIDIEKACGFCKLATIALNRTLARNALAASEAWFRNAFEMAGVGMSLVDVDGRLLQTNMALSDIMGYSQQDLLSRRVFELCHPEYLEKWREAFQQATAADMKKEQVEGRFLHRDGREVWCLVTFSLMTDPAGRPRFMIVQFQDITERHHTQGQLRELADTLEDKVRERTYHLEVLGRLSQDLGFAPNYDEFFRIMMTPLEEVVEYDVAGSLVKSGRDFNLYIKCRSPISDEVQEYISKRLTTAFNLLDNASPFSSPENRPEVNLIFLRKGDSGNPMLTSLGSSFQVPLIVGSVKRVAGILFVGTEKKQYYSQDNIKILYTVANQASTAIHRLERRIQEEKSRLIGIIENLPHGIIILDEKHRIVMMNSVAVRPLMYLCDTGHGDVLTHLGDRPLNSFLSDVDQEEWKDNIRVDDTPPRVFEVIGRTLYFGPFVGGILIALRDITEETSMAERVQQQDRLAAVGQLAAGIAHDFNNLLTSIGGYSEMIAGDDQVEPEVRERADIIRKQVRRAAQLIRQILDFSRKSLSTRHPLELISFLKESRKLLERTIREDVRIEMHYKAGEYVVSADPVGLQQVIANLAINAQDAMPNGGSLLLNVSRISLGLRDPKPLPEMSPGKYIKLTVSDTGSGMSADVASRIFDPFFTTKPAGKGTGLGLSQAMGIIHTHEGFIDVESRPDEGTTFNIFLPSLGLGKKESKQVVRPVTERGREEVILLVEDEDEVRKMGRVMLERIGYQVITARDGREALQLFRENEEKVSLVLTDLVMPRMSGKELIKELKSITPKTKIIAWTGYPLENEDEALQQDIAGWILKPPEIPELARKIRQALQAP